MDTKDELNQLSDKEINILIDFFESQYFEVLLKKYKPIREQYFNKKIRAANPLTGATAIRAIGELQGQNLELNFFFEHLYSDCKRNLNQRHKEVKEKVISASDYKPINSLTGV